MYRFGETSLSFQLRLKKFPWISTWILVSLTTPGIPHKIPQDFARWVVLYWVLLVGCCHSHQMFWRWYWVRVSRVMPAALRCSAQHRLPGGTNVHHLWPQANSLEGFESDIWCMYARLVIILKIWVLHCRHTWSNEELFVVIMLGFVPALQLHFSKFQWRL